MRTRSAVSARSRTTVKTTNTYRTTADSRARHGSTVPFTSTIAEYTPRTLSPVGNMDSLHTDVNFGQPGLYVWVTRGRCIVAVGESQFGFFHEDASYIVLSINTDRESSLHYWLGSGSSVEAQTKAKDRADEIDRMLGCAKTFSKEIMGHESYCFLKNFPDGLIYVEGRVKMRVSCAASYKKRMYVIAGVKVPTASCVHPSLTQLQSGAACILDGHPRIYVWIGSDCRYSKRIKAISLAKRIRNWQRQGKVHIVVIDERDAVLNDSFYRKVERLSDEEQNCVSSGANTEKQCSDVTEATLSRVTGDRVLYDMAEAARRPLQHCYLVKNGSYLLDTGPASPIYIWNGHQLEVEHVSDAIHRVQCYVRHKGYPEETPIVRIREGGEPQSFTKCFNNWRNTNTDNRQVTKSYSSGNIERSLFSRSDNRTIAKLHEQWSDDMVISGSAETEVYIVQDGVMDRLPWSQQGVFNNGNCYVIKHSTYEECRPDSVVYYWIGDKSTEDDQESAEFSALLVAQSLDYNTVVMRVLDNKIPSHFMSVLRNTIVVYDRDLPSSDHKQMFSIREIMKGCTRVSQVAFEYSSFNSSAAFIVFNGCDCYLWYGQHSSATERESSKHILGFLSPLRMYTFDIVMESKEPKPFLDAFGKSKLDLYQSTYHCQVIERRAPRLVNCRHVNDVHTFADIDDFTQADLSEDEVFVLDTFDQVFLWCGEDLFEKWLNLPKIIEAYFEKDSAGRKKSDVFVWYITQHAEPETFTKYFYAWQPHFYTGELSYEHERRKIRQQNAMVELTPPMEKEFKASKKYTIKELSRCDLPNDVNEEHLEWHLTESCFQNTLKISRKEFCCMPEWKKSQILNSSKLQSNEHQRGEIR